ncbi:MAG: alpha/beta fold hydrolase [Bacteroidota bacterium]
MKYIKVIFGILILLVLVLGGIAYYRLSMSDLPKTIPNENDQEYGAFTLEKSVLENRWGDTISVDRGTLVVRENRAKETSNNISVAFIRLRTSNPTPLPPVFFLAGGPGTPGGSVAASKYFYVFKKLAEYGDVVVLDQRGTGNSIPNLSCRNNLSLSVDVEDDVEQKLFENVLDKCRECADEFKELGIALSAYNSLESAHDIDEVRAALGYEKISLYGYSYGSSLAQHYISLFESKVANAIFAGPTAPDLSIKSPTEVEQQFRQMAELLQKDKRFQRYFPDFLESMEKVHDQLSSKPELIKIPLMDAVSEDDGVVPTTIFKTISLFKPNWKLTLTDEHLQMITAQNIGNDFWITRFPNFYYQMSQGNYRDVGNYLRNFRRQSMPNALFFTVNGTTGYHDDRWIEAIEDETALLSHFSISFGRYKVVSEAFGVEVMDRLNAPVYSGVDVLLIGGTLDGRTPMSNIDSLANRFPGNRIIVIENAGHNDLVDDRILGNMVTFLHGELAENDTIIRTVSFIPPVPYKKSLTDTLEAVRASSDMVAAISTYRDIARAYADQEDFIYDLTENSLNNYGYALMRNGLIDEAIEVFKLNVEIFPERYNVYNSLAEAFLEKGDSLKAKRQLQKAIKLNYLDAYSQALLSKLD